MSKYLPFYSFYIGVKQLSHGKLKSNLPQGGVETVSSAKKYTTGSNLEKKVVFLDAYETKAPTGGWWFSHQLVVNWSSISHVKTVLQRCKINKKEWRF